MPWLNVFSACLLCVVLGLMQTSSAQQETHSIVAKEVDDMLLI